MSVIVFDTETSGKADHKLPFDHPTQPRLAQLGFIGKDNDGKVTSEVNLFVKPDGWVMPKETSDFHGITQEFLEEHGLPIKVVMSVFLRAVKGNDFLIAHNSAFDMIIIQNELSRIGWLNQLDQEETKVFCTMAATTDICKIQGKYGYKWPTMQEAYKHYFGEEFEDAHDAMADVRACMAVYEKLQEEN